MVGATVVLFRRGSYKLIPPNAVDEGYLHLFIQGSGVADAGVVGVRTRALLKTEVDPQKFGYLSNLFLETFIFGLVLVFQHFQNKVAKSEEKPNLGGRWV